MRARRLETQRLVLEPLRMEDAEVTQRIFPRWEIVALLNDKVPWPFPEDGVVQYYRDAALPAIERGEEWHWTIRLKEAPDACIGAIMVGRGAEGNRGYWLAPEWKGNGLMTEAVIAVTDFYFGELGFEVLRVSKAVENVGSRRISEKTGMRCVGTEEHGFVSGRKPAERWEVTAQEWWAFRKS